MTIYQLPTPEDFKIATITAENIAAFPSSIDAVSILLVNEGFCDLYINSQNFLVHQGSVITIFHHDSIEVKSYNDSFKGELLIIGRALFEECITRFESNIMEVFIKNRMSESALRNQPESNIRFIYNTFDNLRIVADNVSGFYRYEEALFLLRSLFCFSADQIRKNINMEPTSQYNRIQEHFNNFLHLLFTHYKESREVAFYAAKLNLSPKYLNSITSEVSKSNCKSIIDNYITFKLKNELRTTKKSIQEIAYEYNFSNQSFFGCYFKKIQGCSPRKYRNGGS